MLLNEHTENRDENRKSKTKQLANTRKKGKYFPVYACSQHLSSFVLASIFFLSFWDCAFFSVRFSLPLFYPIKITVGKIAWKPLEDDKDVEKRKKGEKSNLVCWIWVRAAATCSHTRWYTWSLALEHFSILFILLWPLLLYGIDESLLWFLIALKK